VGPSVVNTVQRTLRGFRSWYSALQLKVIDDKGGKKNVCLTQGPTGTTDAEKIIFFKKLARMGVCSPKAKKKSLKISRERDLGF